MRRQGTGKRLEEKINKRKIDRGRWRVPKDRNRLAQRSTATRAHFRAVVLLHPRHSFINLSALLRAYLPPSPPRHSSLPTQRYSPRRLSTLDRAVSTSSNLFSHSLFLSTSLTLELLSPFSSYAPSSHVSLATRRSRAPNPYTLRTSCVPSSLTTAISPSSSSEPDFARLLNRIFLRHTNPPQWVSEATSRRTRPARLLRRHRRHRLPPPLHDPKDQSDPRAWPSPKNLSTETTWSFRLLHRAIARGPALLAPAIRRPPTRALTCSTRSSTRSWSTISTSSSAPSFGSAMAPARSRVCSCVRREDTTWPVLPNSCTLRLPKPAVRSMSR